MHESYLFIYELDLFRLLVSIISEDVSFLDELGWGSIVTSNMSKLVDINGEDPFIALYKVDHLHSERLRKFISVAAQVNLTITTFSLPSFFTPMALCLSVIFY